MPGRTVFEVLEELSRGVAELKALLEPLRSLSGGADRRNPAPASKAARRGRKKAAKEAEAAPTTPAKSVRKGRTARPKKAEKAPKARNARRALQGRYMGVLRSLSNAQKAEVKKVYAAEGIEAAVERAAGMRKSA